jgi:hypothetical protein
MRGVAPESIGAVPTMLDWKRGPVKRSLGRRWLVLLRRAVSSGGGAVARSADDAATRDGNAWLTHTTTNLRWR